MKVCLDEGAFLPTRAHPLDAGLDLYAPEEGWIRARGRAFIDTGVHIRLETDEAGEIRGRSGLARRGVMVASGTIDAPYRGSLGIVLFNVTDDDYHIRRGDRIAQLVVTKIARPVVEQVDALDDTDRGDGGFGSTGR